jgi:predicted nucleotidyltransferase
MTGSAKQSISPRARKWIASVASLLEIDPDAHLTVFDYAGLKDYIASLFEGPVDVVNRDSLKPYVRPAATADAIYAF